MGKSRSALLTDHVTPNDFLRPRPLDPAHARPEEVSLTFDVKVERPHSLRYPATAIKIHGKKS